MRKRRVTALLLTGAMAAASLAGCGSGQEAAGETTKAAAVTEAAATEVASAASEAQEEVIPNFNPEGYPVVDEEITLKIMFMTTDTTQLMDPKDMPVLQKISEETGINIDMEIVRKADWATKFNLTMASGEYPDIIMAEGEGFVDYEKYGVQEGVLIPLDDLIEKYIPNYTDRIAMQEADPTKSLVASDGNTYCLGQTYGIMYDVVDDPCYINQQWLDALNLETPKTIDELTEVLRAFKTQDPNGNGQADEIPLAMRIDSAADTKDILQLFGVPSYGSWMYIDDNKQVQLTAVQDGFRACMEWLHTCYEEKLLDAEVFSMDIPAFRAKLNTGNAGLFFEWRLSNMGYDTMKDICQPWCPEGASFETSYELAKPHTYITVTNQYPEASARLLNEFLEKENMFSLRYGGPDTMKGWRYREGEMGETFTSPDYNKDTYQFEGLGSTGLIWQTSGFNKDNMANSFNVEERMAHCTAIAEAGGVQKYSNSLLSLVKLSAEDREEMGYVQTEAKAAMDEYIAIFVKEGVTDESWNAYVKIFEDMGCDKFVKLYQEGLDQLVIE